MGPDRSYPIAALVIAGLLLGTMAQAGTAAGGFEPAVLAQSGVETDATLMEVTLAADGSASWRIEYRTRLDDENTTEAFESLAADIEANRSAYADRFADRMDRTAQEAENATGREMAIEAVDVQTSRTSLPDEYGVVAYTFEWTGFAAIDGETIRAGDAIAGLFLAEGTGLIVAWPADYDVVEVAPTPDDRRDRAVVWRGPVDFASGEPRLAVAPTGGPTTTPGDGGGDDRAGGGVPVLLVVGGAVVAVLLGGWWVFVRGVRGGPIVGEAGGPVAGEPDESLLSNEERVLRLLREHDGRMKQQQVVEELGWTDAKTSQVVGRLREEGQLEGFRLGRENVLSLPDEPSATEDDADDGGESG